MFGKVVGGLGIVGIVYGFICGILRSASVGVGMIVSGIAFGLVGTFFIEEE